MTENPRDILEGSTSKALLGLVERSTQGHNDLASRLREIISDAVDKHNLCQQITEIGACALSTFLQANVTGPLLAWDPLTYISYEAIFGPSVVRLDDVARHAANSLSVDGESIYPLVPYLELFLYAKTILNAPGLSETEELAWQRLRVNAWHQRMLGQPAAALQKLLEVNLDQLDAIIASEDPLNADKQCYFLLERAAIHILHGLENKAKQDIRLASQRRQFEFILTGKLGRRTKYQQKDVSQLVVLAKSSDTSSNSSQPKELLMTNAASSHVKPSGTQPHALNLDDDTLLESISYSVTTVNDDEHLPATLASIDPNNQPLLEPLDAIILLDTATVLVNDSPADELSREKTLPYAERVLSGGSSNWQVYTQALLVRSRIEGFKSRTVERSVLQLQALVDQVVADTSLVNANADSEAATTTFLPRPDAKTSALASERLKFIHQLAFPFRWKLEAELADRWVSVGGLRTALEIYERLQMWAESALCHAANGREDEALRIIRQELYLPPSTTAAINDQTATGKFGGIEQPTLRDPLPLDAPRLFCILGDIENSEAAYEKAWLISSERYARAQRSLAKLYSSRKDYDKADEAYSKALRVNPQNYVSWFALGCVRLQTERWSEAVEAFGRAVQIEDTDAEAWSNMAVALLRSSTEDHSSDKDVQAAFIAMKRAASLKRESFKLWQNLISVAIKLSPPPYPDIIMAQTRLIELRGSSEGEAAIDILVIEALFETLVRDQETETAGGGTVLSKGVRKSLTDLIFQQVAPLITSSRPLWLLLAKFNTLLKRPFAALSTYEKCWRSVLNQPGWESSRKLWKEVSEATFDLMDAYESLGEQDRESGLGAAEPVCKDWRFKARSAARSVLGRARKTWEGDEAYEQLQEKLSNLKNSDV